MVVLLLFWLFLLLFTWAAASEVCLPAVVRRLGSDSVDDDDGNVCDGLTECLRTTLLSSFDGVIGFAVGGDADADVDGNDDDGKC